MFVDGVGVAIKMQSKGDAEVEVNRYDVEIGRIVYIALAMQQSK